jgi:hypothetical protein
MRVKSSMNDQDTLVISDEILGSWRPKNLAYFLDVVVDAAKHDVLEISIPSRNTRGHNTHEKKRDHHPLSHIDNRRWISQNHRKTHLTESDSLVFDMTWIKLTLEVKSQFIQRCSLLQGQRWWSFLWIRMDSSQILGSSFTHTPLLLLKETRKVISCVCWAYI